MRKLTIKLKKFRYLLLICAAVGIIAGVVAVYWPAPTKNGLIRECPVAWAEGEGMPYFGYQTEAEIKEAKKNYSVMTMAHGKVVNDVYNRVDVDWVRKNCSVSTPKPRPV